MVYHVSWSEEKNLESFIKKNPVPTRISVPASVFEDEMGRPITTSLIYEIPEWQVRIISFKARTLKPKRGSGHVSGNIQITTLKCIDLPSHVFAGIFALQIDRKGICYRPPKEMFIVEGE